MLKFKIRYTTGTTSHSGLSFQSRCQRRFGTTINLCRGWYGMASPPNCKCRRKTFYFRDRLLQHGKAKQGDVCPAPRRLSRKLRVLRQPSHFVGHLHFDNSSWPHDCWPTYFCAVPTSTLTICNVLTLGLNAADTDYDIFACIHHGSTRVLADYRWHRLWKVILGFRPVMVPFFIPWNRYTKSKYQTRNKSCVSWYKRFTRKGRLPCLSAMPESRPQTRTSIFRKMHS